MSTSLLDHAFGIRGYQSTQGLRIKIERMDKIEKPALESDFDQGSSGIPGCYHESDQRPQQGLASLPDVVHEFEEPQVQRQPLL